MTQTRDFSGWYLLLRRIALFVKVSLIFYLAFYLKAKLSLIEIGFYLFLIPLFEIVYRVLTSARFKESKESLLLALMLSDIIILTQILSLTGGPTNPFSIFFLVYLVLTASLLDIKSTVLVAIVTCVSFASLFVWYTPLHALHAQSSYSNFSIHLQGMLYAFILVSIIVTYFLGKILKAKTNAIQAIENIELQKRQFAKVSSITANAAHELGTPLANIAMIAEELNSSALKAEIEKCKNIISDLCIKSGSVSGESYSSVDISLLIDDILEELSINKNEISIKLDLVNYNFLLPFNALKMALKSLIQNAVEENRRGVLVKVTKGKELLTFEIENKINNKAKINVDEFINPFFSTKNNEKNLGLGVYIAKSVAIELGGNLNYILKGDKLKTLFSISAMEQVREQLLNEHYAR